MEGGGGLDMNCLINHSKGWKWNNCSPLNKTFWAIVHIQLCGNNFFFPKLITGTKFNESTQRVMFYVASVKVQIQFWICVCIVTSHWWFKQWRVPNIYAQLKFCILLGKISSGLRCNQHENRMGGLRKAIVRRDGNSIKAKQTLAIALTKAETSTGIFNQVK